MLVYDLNGILSLRAELRKESEKRGDASLSGAFADDDTLTLSVRVPRALCADNVSIRLYRDDDMSVTMLPAKLSEFAEAHDVYTVTLNLSEICLSDDGGLFYYTFVVSTPLGEVHTDRSGALVSDDSNTRALVF